MRSVTPGLMAAGVGMAVNVVLAIIKIVTGIVGHSYGGYMAAMGVHKV